MNKPSIIQLPKILDKRGNLSLSNIFDGFCSFWSCVEDGEVKMIKFNKTEFRYSVKQQKIMILH